jgi:hypothetical protein
MTMSGWIDPLRMVWGSPDGFGSLLIAAAAKSAVVLAAALRTLIARTTRGAFVKSGLPLAEQAARIRQLEQVRQRRQSLLDALKKVDQELGELGQGAGARP